MNTRYQLALSLLEHVPPAQRATAYYEASEDFLRALHRDGLLTVARFLVDPNDEVGAELAFERSLLRARQESNAMSMFGRPVHVVDERLVPAGGLRLLWGPEEDPEVEHAHSEACFSSDVEGPRLPWTWRQLVVFLVVVAIIAFGIAEVLTR